MTDLEPADEQATPPQTAGANSIAETGAGPDAAAVAAARTARADSPAGEGEPATADESDALRVNGELSQRTAAEVDRANGADLSPTAPARDHGTAELSAAISDSMAAIEAVVGAAAWARLRLETRHFVRPKLKNLARIIRAVIDGTGFAASVFADGTDGGLAEAAVRAGSAATAVQRRLKVSYFRLVVKAVAKQSQLRAGSLEVNVGEDVPIARTEANIEVLKSKIAAHKAATDADAPVADSATAAGNPAAVLPADLAAWETELAELQQTLDAEKEACTGKSKAAAYPVLTMLPSRMVNESTTARLQLFVCFARQQA